MGRQGGGYVTPGAYVKGIYCRALLFVIVMEGLNALLKLADNKGLLWVLHPKIKERTFMYADDVVVFLSPVQ
jgi:hypothetical protein